MTARQRARKPAAPAARVHAARPPAELPLATRTETLAIAIGAALLACLAYRGVLSYGFSQDDFLSLARVQGLAPRLAGPWRILANQWFWDACVRMFGLNAWPFHLVVLLAHAACSALLGVLLARRFPAGAAFFAAAVWATHPAHQGALYWISANSEPFMTLFALLACAAFFARGSSRWLAVPAFVITLAWKESALLLPGALFLVAWLGPAPKREPRALLRDPVWLALAGVAVLWAVGIAAFMGGLNTSGNAYEATPGAVFANLCAYASWTPSWSSWLLRDVSDAPRPMFVVTGQVLIALAALGQLWRPWRTRGAAGALLAGVLLVAPVLPLAHHTYRYYLHAPLAAVAFAVAALFAALTANWSRRIGIVIATALAVPFVAASIANVILIETQPFQLEGSHLDRTVDRAVIATNAIHDLRAAPKPAHGRIVMWSPTSQDAAAQLGQDTTHETYEERNVRSALLDGLALRVMVPGIDSVAFVRTFTPGAPDETWGVYLPNGHVGVLSASALQKEIANAPR